MDDFEKIQENKKKGFIVLHRSLLDWEWWTDVKTTHLFIYCLLKANHEDKRWRGIVIPRGSFVTSFDKLALETGISRQSVRTCLKYLTSTQCLTQSSTTNYTLISVVNYDRYQERNTTINMQSTYNQHATNIQSTSNNNITSKQLNNNDVVVVGNESKISNNNDTDIYFNEFWNSYPKHGYKSDVIEYWNSRNYSEDEKKSIVYGAKRYAKTTDDIQHMVFPRTFLKNELWKDYKPKPRPRLMGEEDEKQRKGAEVDPGEFERTLSDFLSSR